MRSAFLKLAHGKTADRATVGWLFPLSAETVNNAVKDNHSQDNYLRWALR